MSLNIIQRNFLQAVSNHGAIPEKECQDILKTICQRYETNYDEIATFENTITKINEEIRPFNQELKVANYPPEKCKFVIFINLTTDAINKFQTDKPKQELDFFRDVLFEIIKSEDKAIGLLYATNLVSSRKGKLTLTKNRAQDLLEEWILSKYFFEKDDKITLGPRAITEFSNYLQSEFENSVNSCRLCKQISFWGLSCTECKEEYHKECILTYMNKKTDCPFCHAPWNTPLN